MSDTITLETITNILKILLLIPLPLTVWQLIIALFGIKKGKAFPESRKKNKFAVLVCARNEESVIGQLIESIYAQNYPADKYKIFVTADNCTDNTAEIARKMGATVFERYNTKKVGKGYAMKWSLERICASNEHFDALCVFDADNLADKNFLNATNNALESGADVTQGYRDTKNPNDSAVSGSYAIYWLLLMRLYHNARTNLGLSCMIGGTGWACRFELIENGWDTVSLTEDVEFSMKQIAAGKTITAVNDAIIYDEQPVDYKTSITQRTRWMIGNMQCARKYIVNDENEKTQMTDRKRKISYADSIIYMSLAYALPFTTIGGILYTVLAMFVTPESWFYTILDFGITVVISYAAIVLIALIVILLEKKPFVRSLKSIMFFPVFIIPMSLISVYALVKKNTEWKPIKHNCTKQLADINAIPSEI